MPVNYNFTATSEKKNKRHMAEHFSGWKKKKNWQQKNQIPCSINSEGGEGPGRDREQVQLSRTTSSVTLMPCPKRAQDTSIGSKCLLLSTDPHKE